MNPTDLDNLIQDYLSRLDAALRGLPTSRRQQLVAEITQHVEESRARLPEQSEAAIRGLLDRVGQPEEIASEAMASEEPRPGRNLGLLAGLIAVVVAAAIAIPLALTTGGSNRKPPNTSPPTTSNTAPANRLVQVPVVVGQPADAATRVLAAVGLVVNVSTQPSTILPAGNVIAEAPAPGSQVVIGSTVRLTVSTGPPSP